jgi:hypothetical protein
VIAGDDGFGTPEVTGLVGSNKDMTRNLTVAAPRGNGYRSIADDDSLQRCMTVTFDIKLRIIPRCKKSSRDAQDYPEANERLGVDNGGRR